MQLSGRVEVPLKVALAVVESKSKPSSSFLSIEREDDVGEDLEVKLLAVTVVI